MGERRTPNTTRHYPALRSPAFLDAQQLSAASLPGLLCASLRRPAAIRRGTPDTTRCPCGGCSPSAHLSCSLGVQGPEQKIRNMLLEVLNRLPNNETLRPHVQVMGLGAKLPL